MPGKTISVRKPKEPKLPPVHIREFAIAPEDGQSMNDWGGVLTFIHTKLFRWITTCQSKTIVIFSGNQMGKCVESQEFLYTPRGIIEANEVKNGEELLGGSVRVDKSFEDDLLEVTFTGGIKIRCNKEHPFWARQYRNAGNENFVSLDKLHIGEYVLFCSPKKLKLITRSLPAPKLFGYLCSDGYITNPKQAIKFTNNRQEFLNEVEQLVKENYCLIEPKCYPKNTHGVDLLLTYDHGESNPLREEINKLGLSKDTFGVITQGDNKSLEQFVAGFFNGDGYLLLRKRKVGWSKLPSVEIGFCIGSSRRKAYEFQYILWRLGISSWVILERMKNSKHDFWRVKVNPISAKELIGFLDHTKYPEKFVEALKCLEARKTYKSDNDGWKRIKSIKPVGKGIVVPIKTESGELYSYCGMKTHNTDMIAMDYVLRILGIHPIAHKNILPTDTIRTFRFCSEVLPVLGGDEAGSKNTQYPAFKRRLPPTLIKRDITGDNKTMAIRSLAGGPDIFVEFTAFSQGTGTQAGVQRKSIWIDESTTRGFFQEQIPRLLAADGDLVYTMTPEPGLMGWEFDELYERARRYVRTEKVRQRMWTKMGERHKAVEETASQDDVTVFVAATDDNPIYERLAKEKSKRLGREITAEEFITENLRLIDQDEEVIDARRYGLFRHLSGRIFRSFTPSIHVVSFDHYFGEGASASA